MKSFKRYSAPKKKEFYETSSKNTDSAANSTLQLSKWKAVGMVKSISKEKSYNELKYEVKPVDTQQTNTG